MRIPHPKQIRDPLPPAIVSIRSDSMEEDDDETGIIDLEEHFQKYLKEVKLFEKTLYFFKNILQIVTEQYMLNG